MRTISIAFAASLALALCATPARSDEAPPPAPVPPAPTDKPADKPAEKPADKPAEKPAEAKARGYIGFLPAPVVALSKKQKEHWSVKAESGVVAVRVMKGAPAERAGLHNGDVMLKYAGKDIPSTKDLDPKDPEKVQAWSIAFQALAAGVTVDSVVEIVVERDGKPVTLKATAIGMDAIQKVAAAAGEDDDGEDEDEDEGAEGPEKGEKGEKGMTPEKVPAPPAPPAPDKPAK